MDKTKLPSMKPVLVTDFNDDIRTVRASDVTQQQTVLTARAVKDIFAGDVIDESNASDQKYFDADGKINLDKIVDAGCRHLLEDTFINGPEYAVRETNTSEGTPLGGFLYTMAQLPDGQLFWGPVDALHAARKRGSINESIVPTSDGEILDRPAVEGDIVRQLFYVAMDELDDPRIYTRIGRYEYYEDENACYWRWGAWYDLCGREQYIVVTDAYMSEVINPILNATYSVHTNVPRFNLPDANDCSYGSRITIIQHPDPSVDDRDCWATRVVYEHGNTTDSDYEKMEITCTPSPRRNTEKADSAYLDGLQVSEYIFEVSPRMDEAKQDGTIIGKTWHLKVNPDETEFTNGLAEILDAHTEMGVNDIIDYGKRTYYEESGANGVYPLHSTANLVLNRSVTADGFVVGKITKLHSSLNDSWTIIVKRFNAQMGVSFVVTTDATPVDGKTYYTKTAYSLGKTSAFQIAVLTESVVDATTGELIPKFSANTTYYEVDEADMTVEDIATIRGGDLTVNVPAEFKYRVGRNDIIYVTIAPGSGDNATHIAARTLVSPVISFVPDPHPGSYISKALINPSAFTAVQYQHLVGNGAIVEEASTDQQPASTAALINAYDYLSSRLASRGLMFGAVRMDESNINECTTDGVRWIAPNTGKFLPNGYDLTKGAYLVTFGNKTAPENMVHEDMQYVKTTDIDPVSGKEYFQWDNAEHTYVSVGTPYVFANGIAYYEINDEQAIREESLVTQLLVQSTNMWIRCLTGDNWSGWSGIPKRNVVVDAHEDEVTLETTTKWFVNGTPDVYCGASSGGAIKQVITIPDPSTLLDGSTITFHFIAPTPSHSLQIQYTVTGTEYVRKYTTTSSVGSSDDEYATRDVIKLTAHDSKWLITSSIERAF